MSEQRKVCKCGDFKEQHENGKGKSVMSSSPGGLPRCQEYKFSHHEEVLSYQEFKEEKNKPGFKLTRTVKDLQ